MVYSMWERNVYTYKIILLFTKRYFRFSLGYAIIICVMLCGYDEWL